MYISVARVEWRSLYFLYFMWYQPNYMDIQKLFAMKVSTLFDASAFNHSST